MRAARERERERLRQSLRENREGRGFQWQDERIEEVKRRNREKKKRGPLKLSAAGFQGRRRIERRKGELIFGKAEGYSVNKGSVVGSYERKERIIEKRQLGEMRRGVRDIERPRKKKKVV
ncbi:hypothetical protein NE237_009173 [Protea cynaroides]|uniref:Uncharacterized protein n=1 Tax=Protea cynaroides TaxID=273540 RepID=A0A9Q0KX24_9MAGN|nr:hypothetical protein NE237_009173 [Protea cynaroides]